MGIPGTQPFYSVPMLKCTNSNKLNVHLEGKLGMHVADEIMMK